VQSKAPTRSCALRSERARERLALVSGVVSREQCSVSLHGSTSKRPPTPQWTRHDPAIAWAKSYTLLPSQRQAYAF
jgi:hypothetical protein